MPIRMPVAWLIQLNQMPDSKRVGLFMMTLGLVVCLWYGMAYQPMRVKQQNIKEQTQTVWAAAERLRQKQQSLEQRGADNPNQQLQANIDALQSQLDGLNMQLAQTQREVVAQHKVASILRRINQTHAGLAPLSLKAPSPEQFAGDGVQHGLYKQTIQLQLRGSFNQAYDYVKALEQLPWQVHLSTLRLSTLNYPETAIYLQLYVLTKQDAPDA